MSTLEITINPTKMQDKASAYLEDDVTTELQFGGGGKSRLICEWEGKTCIRHPDVRRLLGRTADPRRNGLGE